MSTSFVRRCKWPSSSLPSGYYYENICFICLDPEAITVKSRLFALQTADKEPRATYRQSCLGERPSKSNAFSLVSFAFQTSRPSQNSTQTGTHIRKHTNIIIQTHKYKHTNTHIIKYNFTTSKLRQRRHTIQHQTYI